MSDEKKRPAFNVEERVSIIVERELAYQLGRLILDSDTDNTALLALGHQLSKIQRVRNLSD